jgi:hypothetical protein
MTGLKFFVSFSYEVEYDAPLIDAGGVARGTVKSQKTVIENAEIHCGLPTEIDHIVSIGRQIGKDRGLTGPVTVLYFFPFPQARPEMPRILRPGSVN